MTVTDSFNSKNRNFAPRIAFSGEEPSFFAASSVFSGYGARYLESRTGRWLSADPAMGEYIPSPRQDTAKLPGLGGIYNTVNLHVYHYAGNNPVKYTDPDGRSDDDYQASKDNWDSESDVYVPETLPMPKTPTYPLPDTFPVWPLLGTGAEKNVTDNFGYGENPLRPGLMRNHGGIDISAPIGTEVVSVMKGKVAAVGSDKVYGNYIEIDHGNGSSTKYGHLNEPSKLKVGQDISRGTIIGVSGNTGATTGPHLHFEYKYNGEKRDPFTNLFTQGVLQLRR